MSTPHVTMIKQDAVVTIQVGAGFIEKIQKSIMHLTAERSEEEMLKLKDLVSRQKLDELEPWMEPVLTLSTLLNTLETQAVAQGQTYDKPLDDISQPES